MRTVHVVYHREEDGSWWVESPDLPGYTAVGATFREVRALVKEGLDFFLDGEEVDLRESYADQPGVPVVEFWLKAAPPNMSFTSVGPSTPSQSLTATTGVNIVYRWVA